ncbi:hypothetical protein [Pontibacter sp. H249]|uniref:hypothetical protein n=1 Tax=Pontibacter sp. H249 TaxID=3133420 RepID=UPI0030BA3C94
METTFGLILILIITSCSNLNQDNNQNTITEVSPLVTADSLQYRSVKVTASESPESEECIFDQATQTDEFLKEIKELRGYKWDYSSRTATYILETGDTLLLTRGGCYHFTVSAEFRLRNDKTDYSNWSNVYQKSLWIAKALSKEFHYEELKRDIDLNKVTIEDYGYAEAASFENEMLVDNGYVIERNLYPNRTVIKLSKTID